MAVAVRIEKGLVPVLIHTADVESEAIDQLINVSRLPVVHDRVVAMPDVHAGIGATVGSVIPTRGAIIPAAVGVDIGCGMIAVLTSLLAKDLPLSLRGVREAIEDRVPVGFDMHRKLDASRSAAAKRMEHGLDRILDRHPSIVGGTKRLTWTDQLGTLGGGNHFIELCLDELDRVWVMLHSGSRGIGNLIGKYFIELAWEDVGKLDARLPHRDLAYLAEGTQHFEDYRDAVLWAQDYAMENRRQMLRLVVEALSSCPGLPPFTLMDEAVNCHHNYVAHEHHFGAQVWVTRKGAIRAGRDELGIIPGSMGTRSYIVRGLGNEDALCSCSHGAGRRMSRNKAKKLFTEQDLAEQTAGVECRKDAAVIDEIPGAYKDIDVVMENQKDLVVPIHTLKQVLCIKG